MKSVISASRRTDIPAFYLDWLIACLHQRRADIITPRGILRTVDLAPENVHTLVLWSKNFQPFLDQRGAFSDYHLFFNFTVNDVPELEPCVPPLTARLAQMKELAAFYGPEKIHWRFDPILFWEQGAKNNLESFEKILDFMARCGISRCLFSFCTLYQSVVRRARKKGIDLFDPSQEQKNEIVSGLALKTKARGIALCACCQDEFLKIPHVQKSHCIDGHLLSELRGEAASKARDRSQRESCGCTLSIDIGSYVTQPCPHGCFYCYANPKG